jgi:formate-dependent nitrite reductase membrane component NrfD
MEHWGWLIIIYLFLGGLGAGAYVTAFAAEKGYLGNVPGLDRAGYFMSGPIVAFGTILLVFDLGQGFYKPWLILGMVVNTQSVMAWGVYILTAFILIAFIKSYFLGKEFATPILDYAGLFLALVTAIYTGLLLMVVQAIPFWNSYLLPILFVISALSTGLSAATLMAKFCTGEEGEGLIPKIHAFLIAAEILTVIMFFNLVLEGAQGPAAAMSALQLISGSLCFAFWILFLGIGLLIPLVVFALKAFQHKEFSASTLSYSKMGVLIGGFTLRYVIVFAATPVWNGMLN